MLESEKPIVMFEVSTLEFVNANEKKLHLGPKLSYLCNFRLEFEKTIVIFEINTLDFAKMQSFM